MATGKLLSDVVLAAASALAGGLLIALALMTAFVVVGQALLMVRRTRTSRAKGAQGHARAGRPAASGAGVAVD